MDSDPGLTARIGGVVFVCEPGGTHYHVTVRGHGQPGQRPLLGTLTMEPKEWHDLVDADIALDAKDSVPPGLIFDEDLNAWRLP